MIKRENIHFNVDGITLRGWFYTCAESNHNEKHPCIIMTHGFSALKEHGLDQFARCFCQKKMNVLVYDNRHFGESDGMPRCEIDPREQVRDLQAAITFAQSLESVDAKKIGVWGTSFSGGNAIVVAAIDRRVKCIVAQVPFVSGHHKSLQRKRPDLWEAKKQAYDKDKKERLEGKEPVTIAVVTQQIDTPAIIRQPDAFEFFTSIPTWENKVTLRSIENSGDYEPIAYIEKVSPTPMLFIVAEKDTVNTTELALQAFHQALEPKKLLMIAGDHFAPYAAEFDKCSKAAAAWFEQVLILASKHLQ